MPAKDIADGIPASVLNHGTEMRINPNWKGPEVRTSCCSLRHRWLLWALPPLHRIGQGGTPTCIPAYRIRGSSVN